MFDQLSGKLAETFRALRGKGKITEGNIEEALEKIKAALLDADVNFGVTRDFIKAAREKALGQKILRGVNPNEQFVKIIHDELVSIMGEKKKEIDFDSRSPTVVLLVGLNGQGKTTFAGKLSLHLKNTLKKTPLLVGVDTTRPAGLTQLRILAKNTGVDCFGESLGMRPVEIAVKGIEFAKTHGQDVVIVDTAGRHHVDDVLMGEIKEVASTLGPFKPEVLLVADCLIGAEASRLASAFHGAVGLTGVVLTKMDSDARGGAALSIVHETGVPIRFLSTGEKMGELELFHPDRLAGRILGMGDVVSLVEKAEQVMDEKESERIAQKMERGKFSIGDLIDQMDMVAKMGKMSSLVGMIPGMPSVAGDLSQADQEMAKMKVIANSMTKAERENYRIIVGSRIERIARGSGTSFSAVRGFLTRFQKMEQSLAPMMRLMKGGTLPSFSSAQMRGKMRKKPKKGRRGPWGGGFFNH